MISNSCKVFNFWYLSDSELYLTCTLSLFSNANIFKPCVVCTPDFLTAYFSFIKIPVVIFSKFYLPLIKLVFFSFLSKHFWPSTILNVESWIFSADLRSKYWVGSFFPWYICTGTDFSRFFWNFCWKRENIRKTNWI